MDDPEELQRRLDALASDHSGWIAPYERMRDERIPRIGRDGYTSDDLCRDECEMLQRLKREPMFASLQARLQGLRREYVAATAADRQRIRSLLRALPGVRTLLLDYANEAAAGIASVADLPCLRDVLVAIAMEDFTIDYRESLTALRDLYLAAERAGLDPASEFARHAALASPGVAPTFVEFPRHPLLDEARQARSQPGTR